MYHIASHLLSALVYAGGVLAATAEQWRGRSIYQIITDRYALPSGVNSSSCNPGDQTWCGGNWNSIRENLDYIQDAGFTAIWISPVSQNYEGPWTAYGDAYHGYWIADATKLNERFGTSEDLKALSDELHKRGMYLMVDVVVNNVMSTTKTPDLSPYMFKQQSQYHPYCPIQWGNTTSEIICWLGDTVVYLPDVNTTDLEVVSSYSSWIRELVGEYQIDGLRIDAAKHVNTDFWPVFCGAAGVFCIGEVFDDDVGLAAQYQGTNAMDAILNYPIYSGLVDAFAIPGKQNMSALIEKMTLSKKLFKDPGLLGNFLEDQDLPRWANISTDPQSMYNAMVFNFMSDGIPIVYYGQEQGFHGGGDPWNREPLWPSKYANTTTAYQLIITLNTLRNFLVNGSSGWLNASATVLTESPYGIGLMKGDVVTVLTNIGSPPKHVGIAVYTPWPDETALTDILTCEGYATGSNGTVYVSYEKGGRPVVLVPNAALKGFEPCPDRGKPSSEEIAPGNQVVSAARSSVRRAAALPLTILAVGSALLLM